MHTSLTLSQHEVQKSPCFETVDFILVQFWSLAGSIKWLLNRIVGARDWALDFH